MDTTYQAKAAFLLGRVLVGVVYLGAGFGNLAALDGKAAYVASKGVPAPKALVCLASLLLLAGGFSLLTGFRPRLGVLAIACFLVPVTLIMHDFWNMEGARRQANMQSFMGNAAMLGSALMFLAIPRPWAFNLERLAGALTRHAPAPASPTAISGFRGDYRYQDRDLESASLCEAPSSPVDSRSLSTTL